MDFRLLLVTDGGPCFFRGTVGGVAGGDNTSLEIGIELNEVSGILSEVKSYSSDDDVSSLSYPFPV